MSAGFGSIRKKIKELQELNFISEAQFKFLHSIILETEFLNGHCTVKEKEVLEQVHAIGYYGANDKLILQRLRDRWILYMNK